jgi:hypothetical protein
VAFAKNPTAVEAPPVAVASSPHAKPPDPFAPPSVSPAAAALSSTVSSKHSSALALVVPNVAVIIAIADTLISRKFDFVFVDSFDIFASLVAMSLKQAAPKQQPLGIRVTSKTGDICDLGHTLTKYENFF